MALNTQSTLKLYHQDEGRWQYLNDPLLLLVLVSVLLICLYSPWWVLVSILLICLYSPSWFFFFLVGGMGSVDHDQDTGTWYCQSIISYTKRSLSVVLHSISTDVRWPNPTKIQRAHSFSSDFQLMFTWFPTFTYTNYNHNTPYSFVYSNSSNTIYCCKGWFTKGQTLQYKINIKSTFFGLSSKLTA